MEDKILHQMTWIFKPPIFHLAKNLLPTLCIFVKVLQVIELAKWWLKSSIYIFWKVTIRLAIFILVGKLTFLHLKVFISSSMWRIGPIGKLMLSVTIRHANGLAHQTNCMTSIFFVIFSLSLHSWSLNVTKYIGKGNITRNSLMI